MVAVGIGTLLLLIPSIGGVFEQLIALGSQTLMPSPEAAYPWLLALFGTSLFTGFGVARRLQGGTALRRRRLIGGLVFAVGAVLVAGSVFTGVAIANEMAVQHDGGTAGGSRFGPTSPDGEPPDCDAGLGVGSTAQLDAHLDANVDLRPIGTVDLSGERRGEDTRWSAYVASDRQLGQYGLARIGDRTWTRSPGTGWAKSADSSASAAQTIDLQALDEALTRGYRATAEDRGIDVIEGARARHCRISIDGSTFRAAFPQVRWLVGDADLAHWFGQLDYWIFLDGQLGQVSGSANGEAAGIVPEALQGTIDVLLTATERGRDVTLYPPAP